MMMMILSLLKWCTDSIIILQCCKTSPSDCIGGGGGSSCGSSGWACGSRCRWWQCLIVMDCLVG